MVKKGGTNLNNVIPPYSGSNNSAVEALNDGVNSDTMHTEMMQNAGSSSSIECPTFTGDPAATDASYLINSTLVENTNNATGDSLTGGKKNKSKKICMCHGVFDIVHPGHIRHLVYTKKRADILVASLTADVHITKGNIRPYIPQDLRAYNLAMLECVDYVIIDKNPDPVQNLSILKPDYYAKGYEYKNYQN